jgi:hypothetical protein
MLDILRLFLHALAAPLRTQAQLEAEIAMLRHWLNVIRRGKLTPLGGGSASKIDPLPEVLA